MELFLGSRRSGKTLALIQLSAATGGYIMTINKMRAEAIFKQAKDMGYDIPYPVTIQEYFHSNKFDGSIIRKKGLYIDEIEDLISSLFPGIDVHAATFTKKPYMNVCDLDHHVEDLKLWLATNPYLKTAFVPHYYTCPKCNNFIFMYRPEGKKCPACGSEMEESTVPPNYKEAFNETKD